MVSKYTLTAFYVSWVYLLCDWHASLGHLCKEEVQLVDLGSELMNSLEHFCTIWLLEHAQHLHSLIHRQLLLNVFYKFGPLLSVTLCCLAWDKELVRGRRIIVATNRLWLHLRWPLWPQRVSSRAASSWIFLRLFLWSARRLGHARFSWPVPFQGRLFQHPHLRLLSGNRIVRNCNLGV